MLSISPRYPALREKGCTDICTVKRSGTADHFASEYAYIACSGAFLFNRGLLFPTERITEIINDMFIQKHGGST